MKIAKSKKDYQIKSLAKNKVVWSDTKKQKKVNWLLCLENLNGSSTVSNSSWEMSSRIELTKLRSE